MKKVTFLIIRLLFKKKGGFFKEKGDFSLLKGDFSLLKGDFSKSINKIILLIKFYIIF
jgi:hypothetical protein